MSEPFKIFIALCAAFACLVTITPGYAAQDEAAPPEAQPQSAYTLGTGDEIKMSVYGEPDLSGLYKVSSAGTVAVPLIGDVVLEGLTLPEAEDMIASRFANGYLVEPSITLQMEEHRPFYIMGEVKKPGQYNYVDSMTALQAVALAGGFTYRARQSKIRVKNVSGSEKTVEPEVKIQPGDVLIVEERLF